MDELKKILVFRTDRLGDFIISKSVLNSLLHTKKYLIDIVVSETNFNYIKNFKSFNKIYVYKNSYIKFIFDYRKIFSTKYDYVLIHDGKRRSHFISLLIKGKKFSLIKFSKNSLYFKFAKIFNFSSYYNSVNNLLFDNLEFLNLLIGEKQKFEKLDFYFDYEFDKSFYLNDKKYCILHLDEKWFKNYYYDDFTYPEWDFNFFHQIINTLNQKFNMPILITTGSIKVKFIDNLVKNFFKEHKTNIFYHNNMDDKVVLIKNLTFRQIEFILKHNCNTLIACEGGVTHLSHNLNIKTYAFVQGNRKNFYKHWTGHMNNIKLCKRSDNHDVINILSNL